MTSKEIDLELSDDLMTGASEIAKFLYGDAKDRRRVYHLAAKGGWPFFRLGGQLAARKSTMLEKIAEKEAENSATPIARVST